MPAPQSVIRYWAINLSVLAAVLFGFYVFFVVGAAGILLALHSPSEARNAGTGLILLIGLALVALWIYLLPSYVAARRRHANMPALFAFNVLLGWTFLGWALALVWALWRPSTSLR
jgi:hypothetical protein